MKQVILKALEESLGLSGIRLRSISGGDINEAYQVVSNSKNYFIKYNNASFSKDMFLAEKKGLELLSSVKGLKVPNGLSVLELDNDQAILILEFIKSGYSSDTSWEQFAIDLANIHKSQSDQFGLDHNNFIGRLNQLNSYRSSWTDFYYENRIGIQLKMAIDEALIPSSYFKKNESMFNLMNAEIPLEKPSLLHGDLWSGNLMFDEKGKPVFIDPAVYYGNREMDIAMMHLFGGFSLGFEMYQNIFPLEKDWKDRLKFYQLYYILVHVNLFGGHYISSARNIIDYYSSRIL